ncbi:MAG: NTP transferase domain-containing protein [Eubacterium sp.]|nr:NTP transferase domain-containing protein [Eubacterium sp.]
MSRIERAVIMAAGKGERLQPITLETPKPLVKVNGTPMIESVIEALHNNGIYEIYIVVGYLKEQFEYLKEKYEGIVLIDNPYYENCNNISSLYVARKCINNAFILDGDQIIFNSGILNPEFEYSGYNGVLSKEETNEWLMEVDENNRIISCSRTGGSNGWKLYSVSRWNERDGKVLKELLELEFEKNKKHSLFWDDIVMFCHPDKFDLRVYKMNEEDVSEIDSFDELCIMDSSYNTASCEEKNNSGSFIQKHKEIWKFIKFSFTGASTAILEMVVFAFLQYVVFKSLNTVPVTDNAVLKFLGIEYKGYMWSYFLSAVVGYTASYIMNRKLTFKADSNIVVSTILYIIMVVLTITFNTWFGAFLGTWIKNNGYDNFAVVMLTKLLVMVVPTVWTYPLQRFVIHRKKKAD